MKRIIHIFAALIIVLPAFSSCRAISSFFNKGEVVAEVGQVKLYRSDLDKLVPKGLGSEDSTRLAKQYILSWATDLIYLKIAEEQLSKVERDVTKELEDYRKSLLKYRYEQLYVNERLDTAVSEDLVQEYYETHQDQFILQRPVVKARFLNIASDSPSLEPIRKKMASSKVEDLIEADSLAYSSAVKFSTWSDRWIDVAVLAREYAMDQNVVLTKMDHKGWIEHKDTTGQTRLTYISDIVSKGKLAPLEFCEPKIKDIIISTRKQQLLTDLERDLLNDARENGKFVIY